MVTPRPTNISGLLLTHGAGSDADHPTSLEIEQQLAPLPTHRMNFPYRRRPGKRPPDRAEVLLDSLRSEAAAFATQLGCAPETLALGGRSMGGRICSMAVADGLPTAALVLMSYPLHPPGRPDRLRIEHLPQVSVPTLIISGTRDPFGTPGELTEHLSTISGPVTFCWVEGATHDWKGRDAQVAEVVTAWLRGDDVPEVLPKPSR